MVEDENDVVNNLEEVGTLPTKRKWIKSHAPSGIIGSPSAKVQTRSATANEVLASISIEKTEPKIENVSVWFPSRPEKTELTDFAFGFHLNWKKTSRKPKSVRFRFWFPS